MYAEYGAPQRREAGGWGRSRDLSQFRSRRLSRRPGASWVDGDRRRHERRSACSEVRGVRSDASCGVAELGTDGPARRSSLLSPAWWTGPPPIPRRGPPRATNRVTRPPRRSPRRKLLADSGSEPGVNASPLFKEPAARRTQHDGRACSRVGWTIPATHAKSQLTSHRTPDPDVDVLRSGHSSVESGSLSFMRKLSP
jgi:hypothetical protein